MIRLVDLYPRAWRERYGEEFLELLEARPGTRRDRLDIVLGAVDAWVHPQVQGDQAAPGARAPRSFRVDIAVMSIVAGLLIIVAGVATALSPFGGYGYRESGAANAILIGGFIVFGIAAVVIAQRDGVGSIPARVMLGGALVTVLGWPILIVGFFAHTGATIAFGLIRARRGDRIGGAAIVVAAVLLASYNTEDMRALFTIPVGLLWFVAGVSAAMRPARPQDGRPLVAPAAITGR